MSHQNEETDEQLAKKVQKGSHHAFVEVMHRYEVRLKRYALRLVHDEHTMEDVVQNTFIKTYKNINSFDTKRKFSSWIYRITHNEAMDQLRKHKNELHGFDRAIFDNMTDTTVGVEEKLEIEDIKVMVRELVDQLPLLYKEPIALFFLEEKSYEEISDILRTPINTVGTRISRGKKLLVILIRRTTWKKNITFNNQN